MGVPFSTLHVPHAAFWRMRLNPTVLDCTRLPRPFPTLPVSLSSACASDRSILQLRHHVGILSGGGEATWSIAHGCGPRDDGPSHTRGSAVPRPANGFGIHARAGSVAQGSARTSGSGRVVTSPMFRVQSGVGGRARERRAEGVSSPSLCDLSRRMHGDAARREVARSRRGGVLHRRTSQRYVRVQAACAWRGRQEPRRIGAALDARRISFGGRTRPRDTSRARLFARMVPRSGRIPTCVVRACTDLPRRRAGNQREDEPRVAQAHPSRTVETQRGRRRRERNPSRRKRCRRSKPPRRRRWDRNVVTSLVAVRRRASCARDDGETQPTRPSVDAPIAGTVETTRCRHRVADPATRATAAASDATWRVGKACRSSRRLLHSCLARLPASSIISGQSSAVARASSAYSAFAASALVSSLAYLAQCPSTSHIGRISSVSMGMAPSSAVRSKDHEKVSTSACKDSIRSKASFDSSHVSPGPSMDACAAHGHPAHAIFQKIRQAARRCTSS
mmetsp:Transcript_5824/g.20410  ORF Transcript_5824/g.20410 Transcript_5824/m.20410 type:complete len:506 (-) Transcript_5824:419-1936(-)